MASLFKRLHGVSCAIGNMFIIPFMVKPILEELEIESFISYNGQYVVFEGEVIYKNPSETCGCPGTVVFIVSSAINTTGCSPSAACFNKRATKGKEIYQLLLFCRGHEEKAYAAFPEFDYVRWHELSTELRKSGICFFFMSAAE
jgi:hypothetical protein